MQLPTGVTLGRITESIRFDDFGHALRVKIITYRVGADGPFTLEIAPENDTPDGIRQLLEAQAEKIRVLRGGE